MKRVIAIALLAVAAACNRPPAESTYGSTDTLQPSTTGTTATETGGGPPITTTSPANPATPTDTASTGNASGSGGTGTSATTSTD